MRIAGSIVAFLILTAGFVSVAHAQFLGVEPVTVTVSPQYPAPYQTVTISPSSTLVDLSASTVTITVNGKPVYAGTGSEGASFAVGGPGEESVIVISVENNGQRYEKRLTIAPASVALVMEPVSTTHPFYAGAALLAPQGRVRLIALADLRTASGATLSPASLVYNWKLGDQQLLAQSGIGRSSLTALAPLRYRDADLTVTVSSMDGRVAGQASITLEPADPKLVVYRQEPLRGADYENALSDSYTMMGDEDSFRAVPYFFATRPTILWNIDGKDSGTDAVVTVRTTGQGGGTAALSVDASLPNTLEGVTKALSLSYGASAQASGFFGL